MNVVRCDRCKKEVKSYESKQIEIKEKRRVLLVMHEYYTKSDLCEECHKELLNWLGGKRC